MFRYGWERNQENAGNFLHAQFPTKDPETPHGGANDAAPEGDADGKARRWGATCPKHAALVVMVIAGFGYMPFIHHRKNPRPILKVLWFTMSFAMAFLPVLFYTAFEFGVILNGSSWEEPGLFIFMNEVSYVVARTLSPLITITVFWLKGQTIADHISKWAKLCNTAQQRYYTDKNSVLLSLILGPLVCGTFAFFYVDVAGARGLPKSLVTLFLVSYGMCETVFVIPYVFYHAMALCAAERLTELNDMVSQKWSRESNDVGTNIQLSRGFLSAQRRPLTKTWDQHMTREEDESAHSVRTPTSKDVLAPFFLHPIRRNNLNVEGSPSPDEFKAKGPKNEQPMTFHSESATLSNREAQNQPGRRIWKSFFSHCRSHAETSSGEPLATSNRITETEILPAEDASAFHFQRPPCGQNEIRVQMPISDQDQDYDLSDLYLHYRYVRELYRELTEIIELPLLACNSSLFVCFICTFFYMTLNIDMPWLTAGIVFTNFFLFILFYLQGRAADLVNEKEQRRTAHFKLDTSHSAEHPSSRGRKK